MEDGVRIMEAIKQFGANTEYRKLHYWVERQLGKPRICEICGSTNKKRYDWANVSGNYFKDIKDWQRLCRNCHMLKGNIDYCKRGHPRKDNTYIKPDGKRRCNICHRLGFA